jgi:hypothetical protein
MPRYVAPRKGYIKRDDRFVARMTVDNKQVSIGTFDTEEEAQTAYLEARSKVFTKSPRVVAIEKGDTHYTPEKPCKNGHNSQRNVKTRACVECAREWAAKNVRKDVAAKRTREYRARKTDDEKRVEMDRSAERSRQWRQENKKHHLALTKMHAKSIKERTPPWADKTKLVLFYKGCPSGYHVDHIIPLRGKTVSGLHVESNLQYLPARENLMKNNKFQPDWI